MRTQTDVKLPRSFVFQTSPWQAIRMYRMAGVQLKQEGDLPDSIAHMADGTAKYEAEIRSAWTAFKIDPTPEKAREFIDFLKRLSKSLWPEVMAAILGIGVDELTVDQRIVLEDALDEHHTYMEESLLPDVVRAIANDQLDSLDYRTIVLYAGALWQFGNLVTVMFDGTELRDLADLFMFAGPDDSETCTGPRGCQQYANGIYTVAQILAEEIIPGRMRCLTNCRHFLLPIASPLKGAEKHLPGQHDQRLHAPEQYRGQAIIKPGPQVYVSERIRELMNPDSETNTQARENWDKLSHSERMKLLDPKAIDKGIEANLSAYREDYERPHDLSGAKLTGESYDQVAANAHAHIDSLKGALSPTTEEQLRAYVDKHARDAVQLGLKDKSIKMDAGQLDDMMRKNVDKMVHQEIESRKRQLGDHGIRHVVGNMRAASDMLDDPDLPPTNGLQRMMALQTMVDHDMGYTAGVVTKSFEATKYHQLYSEKYAKAQGYEQAFGKGNAKEIHRMVREHAHTDLDWEKDPVMSAVRTADNTALFSREKLPALFYDVPGATDELYRLQLANAAGAAKEMTPKVKDNLHKLIDDSKIDPRQKAELHMAADEVSPRTGKFTLGMAAGEIDGYDYKDKVMNIKIKGKPERELLTGMFDLGDRQFDKFVGDYDATGGPSTGGMDLSKGGKKVLHIEYTEPTAKPSGTLATMYSDSVRPDIRSSHRQLGPTSSAADRARIWPAIEASIKGKLNASELAEFERRFKADTLDEMPLTERERSYLETQLKQLKHLPGMHDQSAHTPKAYGRGKRINSGRSKELSQQCDAQSKECYKNAFMALAHVGEGAKYVEGYVVDNVIGFPFEHGWIETKDELLDPTLIMLDDDLAARYTYFPAYEFTHDEMFAEFDAAGDATLPLTNLRSPKQQAAFRAAMEHLGADMGEFQTKHLSSQRFTMSEVQWESYKQRARGWLAQLLHRPYGYVLKHLPGMHDQSTHTPKKYGQGAPNGLSDRVAKAFDEVLGVQPAAKSYNVLSQEEFNARYGNEFGKLIGETAAVTTDDNEIYVAEGNESFGVHELVHATGFMNDGVGTYINEGMTQAAAEDIARLAGVEVAITYQREVEHVRKYLLPATGLGEREFYRGYAQAEDKGKFLVDAIWEAHGGEFSNVDDWGTDPKVAMENSIPWTVGTGYQPHLYYLVDELQVTEKHLPGQHDQRSHTPHAYRGGGVPSMEDYWEGGGETSREAAATQRAMIVELSNVVGVDVGSVVQSWKDAPNTGESIALQRAAADELGADLSDWQRRKYADVKTELSEGDAKALVREIYARTQYDLEAAGIDEVTVYRGVGPESLLDKGQQVVGLDMNALESWSLSPTTAYKYGPLVMQMTVPRDQVFSTYRTGIGAPFAQEVVILGKQDKASVHRYNRDVHQTWIDKGWVGQWKHLPGMHDQQFHAPKAHRAAHADRVWTGEGVDAKSELTKAETGEIGEEVAMRALSELMGVEFRAVNVGLNNAPIDVLGDHVAVEVKTGSASNGPSAQHWRATIGEPGVGEREALNSMTKDEKRVHNQRKHTAIMERKQQVLDSLSERAGAPVTGVTVGVILAPDGGRADVYTVPGFHQRLAWKDYATDEYYVGTYNVEGVALKHLPGMHDQSTHTPKAYAGGPKMLGEKLEDLRPRLAAVAQEEYDAWEQDVEGMDVELAGGGICDRMCERMQDVVASELDVDIVEGGQPGADHAWFFALDHDTKQAFGVDIPPSVYETGGGYSWRKLPDVEIRPHDVVIWEDDYEMLVEYAELQ